MKMESVCSFKERCRTRIEMQSHSHRSRYNQHAYKYILHFAGKATEQNIIITRRVIALPNIQGPYTSLTKLFAYSHTPQHTYKLKMTRMLNQSTLNMDVYLVPKSLP